MAVYFVTGKLGSGKSLVAVGRIKDYLLAGKPVATNLDLYLDKMLSSNCKSARVIRLPDKPTIADLEMLGNASVTKREEDNGLIVLDELGTWFNSRTYQDKGRMPVINWLLHSRKKQWDLMLIVQDIDLIDKQIRIALNEHIVQCKRTDRVPVPLLGMFFKKKMKFPRVHFGNVFYGEGPGAIRVDTWIYRGNHLFACYDTNQIFRDDYEHGLYSFLPPGYLKKNNCKRNVKNFMRITKIVLRKYSNAMLLGMGFFLSFAFFMCVLFLTRPSIAEEEKKSSKIFGFVPVPSSLGPIKKVENNKKDLIIAESKEDKKEIENSSLQKEVKKKSLLKRANYIEYTVEGKSYYKILYDGKSFDSKDFPLPLSWKKSVPYYQIEE